jgi:GGDEF domain-containing protein
MGDIFSLATDDRAALDEAAHLNPLDPGKLEPSAFAGVGQQAKGLLRPSAGAGRTILMSGAPVAQALDWVANLNPARPKDQESAWTESYFQAVDDLGGEAVDFWTPDAREYGTAAKTVGVLSNVVGSVPQMFGTPALFLANSGIDPATELVRQGVDTETAMAVGGANLAANAVGMKLPASVGTNVATRMASGAGMNLAVGAAADAASAAALESGGYETQAQGYDVTDPFARGLDVLMGAAFGIRANMESAPRAPLEQRDAVLTARNAEHLHERTMPGEPLTPKAQRANTDAVTSAIDQMLRGEQVDVAARIDPAQFRLPAPPPVARAAPVTGNDYTPEYRRALESGGVATAKNPKSSAYGADQFTAGTWRATVARAKPAWADGLNDAQLLALRADPVKSGEMAAALDADNARILREAGQPVTRHTMYAAHHFGADKAVAFARAADDAPMSSILTPKQLAANKYLAGKTKAQAIAGWDARAAKAGVKFESAPPRQPFADPDAVALARVEDIGRRYEIPDEALRQIATPAARDSVTGFFDGRADGVKADLLNRAVEHVDRTGEAGHFVSVDISNLGGLNEAMGNRAEAANVHYNALANILAKELQGQDVDVVPIRTGGDEFGAVVLNAKGADVDAAIARAQAKVAEYAQAQGLAEIPHPKRSGEKGVGLHIGRAEIKSGGSVRSILDEADGGVDLSKQRTRDVARIEARTDGAAASAEPARGAGGGAGREAAAGRGVQPAGSGGKRGAGAGESGRAGDRGGPDAAGGAGRSELDDVARVAAEQPDAQVFAGYDADGNPIYESISDVLVSIEAERAQAVRDADAFDAAASCFLRRGAA